MPWAKSTTDTWHRFPEATSKTVRIDESGPHVMSLCHTMRLRSRRPGHAPIRGVRNGPPPSDEKVCQTCADRSGFRRRMGAARKRSLRAERERMLRRLDEINDELQDEPAASPEGPEGEDHG